MCSHCKTNVIICNINNNNVQTKNLKIDKLHKYNIKDDDPVEDINDICFIIIYNFKNNNVQTKDLKNKHNDDPLDDIYDIYSIINFLSYKP